MPDLEHNSPKLKSIYVLISDIPGNSVNFTFTMMELNFSMNTFRISQPFTRIFPSLTYRHVFMQYTDVSSHQTCLVIDSLVPNILEIPHLPMGISKFPK